MMKYILPIVSTVAFPPSFRWMLYLLLFKYKVSADIGARALLHNGAYSIYKVHRAGVLSPCKYDYTIPKNGNQQF